MKKILSLVLICYISITFFACAKNEQSLQDYVDIATYNARNLLIENNYNDIIVSAEKSTKTGDTQFYNLLLTPNKDTEYIEILKILDILNTNTYFDASKCDYRIFFSTEYFVHSSGRLYIVYNDKLEYSYGLRDIHHNIVYNAIAEKKGIGLTMDDKSVIYLDLVRMLNYENSSGKYVYTEEYCFDSISSEYNISVDYIKTEVYIPDVFEYIYPS